MSTTAPPPSDDDDLLELLDDDGPAGDGAATGPAWQVLIVDDDDDVHHATQLALRDLSIEGRPIALLHAHSGQEARTMIEANDDLAVVLLDVVMESPDAGLKLVREVR